MNKSSWIISFALLIFISPSYSQTEDTLKKDTNYFRATLVPLKVHEPTYSTKNIKIDYSNYLIVTINRDCLKATINNKATQLNNSIMLDKFIKSNIKKFDKSKVALRVSKDLVRGKLDEVVHVFKQNQILKFKWLTFIY